MPDGTPTTAMLTLGYEPSKQKFVGTWYGSMMTTLWVYEGELDASGNVLTLNTEGPNFDAPGTTARYREVIELKSDTDRTFTSFVQTPDGSWKQLMQIQYRRAA